VKMTISHHSAIAPISITWDSETSTIERIGIGDRCAPATGDAEKTSAPASVAVLQEQLDAYFTDPLHSSAMSLIACAVSPRARHDHMPK
jgi:hypothetical protein